MHDLTIRGARIIDGTGADAFTGDVGIDGGRISAVGRVGRGRREVKADGRLLTPGFVDFHTHYDGQVTWDPYLTPSSWHGVTTVVMGNCGVGFAPVKPNRHDWLIGLMEGVEDIPGAALSEGIEWGWSSFPEYLDAIEKTPHAIDYATQIPHGALRAFVMDERGAGNEVATPEDVQRMKELVTEALKAGALGFSTSRTMLHKAMDGTPVPGTFANRHELLSIAQAIHDAGHGIFEMAIDHHRVPDEFPWMEEIAAITGQPVVFNFSQFDQAPELWRDILQLLDNAAGKNLPVLGQVAGRAIGIMMGLELTAHPFAAYPSWQKIAGLPVEERIRQCIDPNFRARILAETPLPLDPFETFVTQSFHKMYPVPEHGVNYEPAQDESVAALAKRLGKPPQEVAFDCLTASEGRGMLYFPLFNYADNDLNLLHELHQSPHTRMGLSDAGAHCGAICDGGMPTFMLTHWTRDRQRGPTLSLEYIIRRQTLDTARTYGLYDRGCIAPGFKADINLIDYDNLCLRKPEVRYDLPAQGRRLVQRAKGYDMTIMNGTVILESDTHTGALPGQLIRGPQKTP